MVASKTEGKRDWVRINNMLQWSFLLSIAIYLAMDKTGLIKSSGEQDLRTKRYESLLKKNENEKRNSLPDKLTGKETCHKIFEGFDKRRKRRSMSQDIKLWRLTTTLDRILNGSVIIPMKMRGPPGPKGMPGDRGKRGKAGPRGLKGTKGDPGLTGPIGSKGLRGLVGPKGVKGDRGDRGLQGLKGESLAAPKIIVPPRDLAVTASGTATFTCEATGNPKPEIILVLKNKKIDERFTKIGEGLIEIRNVKFEDRGQISCIAKSILGQDEQTAALEVQVPAKATIAEKNVKTEEGYDVQIQCNVEGNPEPTITWERIGKKLPTSVNYQNKKKTIVIRNVKVGYSGTYVCKAKNSLTESTTSTAVTVFKRLSFLLKPESYKYALQTQDASLSCTHNGGAPPVTITWLKNGAATSRTIQLSMGGQVLHIRNMKGADAGNYTCIVKSFVSVLQNSARLYVDVPITCSQLRRAGQTRSGTYTIAPTGTSSQVYCDMDSRTGEGVTVVSHDSELRTKVDGIEAKGGYKRKINYNIPLSQVKALIKLSSKCEQFIKYECKGSYLGLHHNPHGWWVSVAGKKMTNWGGVDSSRSGCACSLNNSCNTGTCNCDVNDSVSREDKGLLSEKEYLPVTELRFGDTGDGGEVGYHTLGKLKCY